MIPAMRERNVIQQAFDEFGKSAGMTKLCGAWHLRFDEVISLTNLQKSQYGPSYYVNQGWWIVGAEDKKPDITTCHVRARIESLVAADDREVAALLDLDEEIAGEDRRTALAHLFSVELLQVICAGSTVDGLRTMRRSGQLDHAGIRAPAIDRLS